MYENYMGQKGYTIYKNNLKVEEQEELRRELTAKPFVAKNSMS